jgi:hypothetical protein
MHAQSGVSSQLLFGDVVLIFNRALSIVRNAGKCTMKIQMDKNPALLTYDEITSDHEQKLAGRHVRKEKPSFATQSRPKRTCNESCI